MGQVDSDNSFTITGSKCCTSPPKKYDLYNFKLNLSYDTQYVGIDVTKSDGGVLYGVSVGGSSGVSGGSGQTTSTTYSLPSYSCEPVDECCAYLTLTDPSSDTRLSNEIMDCNFHCENCIYPYPCDENGWWVASIFYTFNFGDLPSEINNYNYCCGGSCSSTTTTTTSTQQTTTTQATPTTTTPIITTTTFVWTTTTFFSTTTTLVSCPYACLDPTLCYASGGHCMGAYCPYGCCCGP